ncbi:MAG: hypothetical protein KJP25_08080 [Gammaproteobacteria bacterium]|nr:hypothetical protein [Gammaproteobacteria bacterium]MBT8152078.1 hypothetical protein [Gammaproteobacteria bacterium]RZV54243.1 MAG: hypothetical protein EX270_07805 [Pseudomonadales bacterium]
MTGLIHSIYRCKYAHRVLLLWSLVFAAQSLALDHFHSHEPEQHKFCAVCAVADLPSAASASSGFGDIAETQHTFAAIIFEEYFDFLPVHSYLTRAPPKA